MEQNNKRLKQEYKQGRRPMGIFLIRNLVNHKVFVGAGLDLAGIMNRHRFDLTKGAHRNKQLQQDWNEFGSNSFAFEIWDQLTPRDGCDLDYRKELSSLEKLCLERLQPFGDRGYNERKPGREEMLRRIAAHRIRDG